MTKLKPQARRKLDPVIKRAGALALRDQVRADGLENRGWALLVVVRSTGPNEQVWQKSYVQPRRDARSRRVNIQTMTARGLGARHRG